MLGLLGQLVVLLLQQGQMRRMDQVGRLPVLERLQRVRQDVPGQFALVRKGRPAVHARIDRTTRIDTNTTTAAVTTIDDDATQRRWHPEVTTAPTGTEAAAEHATTAGTKTTARGMRF